MSLFTKLRWHLEKITPRMECVDCFRNLTQDFKMCPLMKNGGSGENRTPTPLRALDFLTTLVFTSSLY